MAPDLFRLKLVLALAAAAAVCLCYYAIQRVYYYLKTRKADNIDTIHFHVYPDGIVALGGIVMILVSISGLTTLLSLRHYHTVEAGETLLEFDAGAGEKGELKLSLYAGIDVDTPFAKPLDMHVLPGDTFEVVVEEVHFRSFLSVIGQRTLVRPVALRSVIPDPDEKQSQIVTIPLSAPAREPFLPWLFESEVTPRALRAPGHINPRDIVALRADGKGALELTLKPDPYAAP
ncbi:MAG: hypothetical protein L6Q71_05320 [Planctomycetes bacterium]|nr:hypothetical protein [Planctomycetota bacterium]NUQ35825.1 hypothetical protein [Planctomycetaceae bacterium]